MLMSSLLHLISDRGDSSEHESHIPLPAVCFHFCELPFIAFVKQARHNVRWITDFPAILGTMTETHSCLESETVSDPVSIQDNMALAAV